nr:unnamed protein product [Callosobruchus chinensis]
MLRDSATAILENLSSFDRRDYSEITSALKLRFEDAHLTELLHGQLHNRTQQAKKDLLDSLLNALLTWTFSEL